MEDVRHDARALLDSFKRVSKSTSPADHNSTTRAAMVEMRAICSKLQRLADSELVAIDRALVEESERDSSSSDDEGSLESAALLDDDYISVENKPS
jgi:hypothetical protein